jgi:ubiquinone/menaquinone biosynthesis C-methylase UbiE
MPEIQLRDRLKTVRNQAEHAVTRATGVPPRRIRKGISPLWFDFKQTGNDQLEFLVELCGLQPTDRVLDIGCGVGRMAIPLTRYINSSGGYDGFDILPEMIDWCEANISSEHPNFRFHVAEVNSSISALQGKGEASEYRFPWDDATFDMAYAGSLFTHLTPEGTENYLRETARTLKAGGKLVATFNMYNKDTQDVVPGKRLEQYWPNDFGNYRTKEKDAPESNVAYDESYVRSAYAEAGLTIVDPIRPDASYSPARAPKRGDNTANLWYSSAVIAVRQ